MKWISSLSKLSLIISLLLLFQCEEKKPDTDTTTKGRTVVPEQSLTFLTADGESVATLQVALADNDTERSEGLMDVQQMPADTGMLFIFDQERQQSFWMANTPLPLDIMYVNSDSVILRIYQNTTPFSQTTLPSEYPAQFVVETNGGYSIENGISEGMKVRF